MFAGVYANPNPRPPTSPYVKIRLRIFVHAIAIANEADDSKVPAKMVIKYPNFFESEDHITAKKY